MIKIKFYVILYCEFICVVHSCKGLGNDLSVICHLKMPLNTYYLVFFSLDQHFQETFRKAK